MPALAVLLTLAFAYFVWPTPWRDLPIRVGAGHAGWVAARQHRVTGRIEYLRFFEWVAAPPAPQAGAPK